MHYSLTKAAAILEVHRNTLAGWVERGCPTIQKADRASGKEWEISIAAVIDWRIKCAVDDAVGGLLSPDGKISKDEADRRKAVAQAQLAEIEVDERQRAVMLVSDGQEMMADFCQSLRSGLDNGIVKTAGRTAGMADPHEIRAFLEVELNRSMEIARSLLSEKWADWRGDKDHDDEGANTDTGEFES